MISQGGHGAHTPPEEGDSASRTARYERIAAPVESDRRYALMRIGSAHFAYSDYRAYLGALGRAWAEGLEPAPLPPVLGSELTAIEPYLCGVDVEADSLARLARVA